MNKATKEQLKNAADLLLAVYREFNNQGETAISFHFSDGKSWFFHNDATGLFSLQPSPEIAYHPSGLKYTKRPPAEIWAIIEAILLANFEGKLDPPGPDFFHNNRVLVYGNSEAPVDYMGDEEPAGSNFDEEVVAALKERNRK